MKIFKISSVFMLIYIGVIILLLYVVYNHQEVYRYNIDGLQVIETSTLEHSILPKRIKSIDLTYKGLSFSISRKSPVILESEDNVIRKSKVTNINIEENRLILELENSLFLSIRVDNRGQRLAISSSIPKVFPTIKEITIPFKLGANYNLDITDLSYKISGPDDEFHLKLNDLYYIDSLTQRIHLISDDDKITTLTFSPLSNSELPLAEQWYKTNNQNSEVVLEDQIQSYLDKIEKGINSTFNSISYNNENNIWSLPNNNLYTENSTIVYLAQGMKNKNYTARLNRIKALKTKNPQIFTYKSTPFLGNIVINGPKGITQYNQDLETINSYIRTSDIKIYTTWIPEYYFDGEEINLTQLENAFAYIEPKNLSLESLAITLYDLLHILDSGKNNSITTNRVKEISDIILEKISWDDTGLYLLENDGKSYMELNLIIGQLLIKASQHESSKYSKPIGESLIKTYINNSDQVGNVNKNYNIEDQILSQETIRPEDSFLALSTNPYIPHYYKEKGIKIWTISDAIDVTHNAKETRITITYPMDYRSEVNSHFLTISGIEPYKNLYFRNKQWRPDRSFERWGIGYYYAPESKLLFFMPNHTKSREEIVITY